MINSSFNQQKLRIKAAAISIILHIFLLSIKLIVGFLSNSLSIIALAADSGFDLIASFATYWGILQISKPADLEHPYGHGKYEFLASVFQAVILFSTAILIIVDAMFRLIYVPEISINLYSFAIMIIGIVTNIFLNRYLLKISRKTNSLALEANSINSLSDILNYIIVFVGLVLIVYLDMIVLDAIIAFVISLFVFYGGLKLSKKAVGGLLDKVPREVKIDRIKEISESIDEVLETHSIRMRASGPYIFIDLHVTVAAAQSVQFSHFLTQRIEKEIKKEFPSVTDILAHIEPQKIMSSEVKNNIKRKILELKEVQRCHHIHFGSTEDGYFLDCHVIVDGMASLDYVHGITKKIEENLKDEIKSKLNIEKIDILVHAEPSDDFYRKDLIDDITHVVKNVSVVENCHNINIRVEEKEILCSLHIIVKKDININEGHEISNMIEKIVEAKLKEVSDEKPFNITIHIEPFEH
ncbi:MAG: cation diffusion facilitator family transporter [Candidatus Helarchaeota archaeon]|nr:cation diffusion facilitator family transporter [Candidatus Helarchaeota archaeon]